MSYRAILYYVMKILIVIAQTSDMPPIMKEVRVSLLTDLAKELVIKYD